VLPERSPSWRVVVNDPPTAKRIDETSIESLRSESPWLTVQMAADRAHVGPKTIYKEVAAKRLKAAKVGGRRELRFLAEWVDQWLLTLTTIE
jgi:excisionase family DNA binding protein